MLLALLAGCTPAAPDIPRSRYRVPELGLDVAYIRGGTAGGRRVVFVHGTPGDAEAWADFVRATPPGYEFIAVDRPGFGQSRPDQAMPSLARQAQALAPLLLPGRQTILVGHSYGGPVIAEAAADYPGRVAGLVIVAGALDPAQEKVLPIQYAGEWWGIRSMIPRSLRNANRELLPLKGELARLAPRLSRIGVPVTIIHGTRDDYVPYANMAFMRTRLTHARPLRTITITGADHFLPWTHRALILNAIRALGPRA